MVVMFISRIIAQNYRVVKYVSFAPCPLQSGVHFKLGFGLSVKLDRFSLPNEDPGRVQKGYWAEHFLKRKIMHALLV